MTEVKDLSLVTSGNNIYNNNVTKLIHIYELESGLHRNSSGLKL